MKVIKDVLKKYEIKPKNYRSSGKVSIIDTNKGTFVVKKKNNQKKLYDYLDTRSFNYYPKVIDRNNDEYEITEYVNEIEIPDEQKLMDMIKLVSLLHNKTTYYKEVSEDYFKEIYEDIKNNIEHLNGYYSDIITNIETKIYMSPSEYLFARNVSELFNSLGYTEAKLEEWYNIVKEQNKVRFVVLHNNLDLSHFIMSNKPYLINWDKSKVDMPLFDIYKLYKRVNNKFDFEPYLKIYEANYPLRNEERLLLFILIALPDKIELKDNEYEMCTQINNLYENIFRTETLISKYTKKEEK